MRNITVPSKIRDYTIYFDREFSVLNNINNYDVMIIDKNVQEAYPHIQHAKTVVVDCIESNKTLDGCADVLSKLISFQIIKSDAHVLAIGGGILQDIVGFCIIVSN